MKVITYSDPRKIQNIDNWDELKKIPQLCVSQTLVQGLSQKCSRKSFSILTTIDRFLNYYYKDWKSNSSLSIRQFIDISDEVQKIEDLRLRRTFYKNRSEIAKSMILLKELDIIPSDFKEIKNNKEFNEFRKIYINLYRKENWNILDYDFDKGIEDIKLCFKLCAIDDIRTEMDSINFINEEEYISIVDERVYEEVFNEKMLHWSPKKKKGLFDVGRKSKEEICIDRIKASFKFIKNLSEYEIKKIVIHGVHQFKPLMIRFINSLERLGIEVIFLINYNKKFREIYSTWENVYNWTKCEFEINDYEGEEYRRSLAKDYGNVLMGKIDEISNTNHLCTVFDNATEFSNYVAECYSTARNKIEKNGVKINKSSILSNMTEQFYSVDGENTNEILSVYFPEQFGEKHFLSYPIGQFILGLYDMWDFDEEKLKINEAALKECLSINLWSNDQNIVPSTLYNNLKCYFVGVESSEMYLQYIDELLKYSTALRNPKYKADFEDYKHLSFFKLEPKEIEFFKRIIIDLINIANKLFKDKGRIDLKNHYKELMEVIKEKTESSGNIDKYEYKFVTEIFDSLSQEKQEINSSIREVKDTLHYYLMQKKESNSSNWIVRDFEQIDGAIFLADPEGKEKPSNQVQSVYHYAEISDNNVISSTKAELPWPIKEEYFVENNDSINIYLNCKNEYSNFLKCSLFYGIYYLNRDVKISYIKNNAANEEQTLFFALRLLNIEEKEDKGYSPQNISVTKESRINSEIIDEEQITIDEMRMMNFCKRRFYYEGLFDKCGAYSTEFLSKQFIKVLLALKVRKEIELGYNNEMVLNKRIENGRRLIKAWDRDFADIKSYIIADCKRNNRVPDDDYIEIKKSYLSKVFTNKDGDRKEAVDSCKTISQKQKEKIKIIEYIKNDNSDYYNSDKMEEKCNYCKYREICTYL